MTMHNCLTCTKPIPFERRRNKYCGHACAAKSTNSARRKIRLCIVCSTDIGAKRWARATCSHACDTERKYRAFVAAWFAGEVVGGSWYGVSGYVRRWLVREYGERCSVCGWAQVHPVTRKVPVQVDHKNGDPDDHSPRNVRLLCPNCHSLTPTYGNLNRGRGRKARYTRRLVPSGGEPSR